MNSKKIAVYQYDILFEILEEVKDKFNFDIIKVDKENLNQIKNDLKEDFLLISKSPLHDYKNAFLINDKPIKIEKLLEQINLKFLKSKFSSQSDIEVGFYKLNLNSREISKETKVIQLTEREMNLILFLKNSKKPVKIEKLQRDVWDYNSELETHTVETHIYRLRKKIKDTFEDGNFIISSKDGYVIE